MKSSSKSVSYSRVHLIGSLLVFDVHTALNSWMCHRGSDCHRPKPNLSYLLCRSLTSVFVDQVSRSIHHWSCSWDIPTQLLWLWVLALELGFSSFAYTQWKSLSGNCSTSQQVSGSWHVSFRPMYVGLSKWHRTSRSTQHWPNLPRRMVVHGDFGCLWRNPRSGVALHWIFSTVRLSTADFPTCCPSTHSRHIDAPYTSPFQDILLHWCEQDEVYQCCGHVWMVGCTWSSSCFHVVFFLQ